MNKYILIGIPNCGKSTLGEKAAEILNLPFYDTDRMAYAKLYAAKPEYEQNPVLLLMPSAAWQFKAEQLQVMDALMKLNGSAIIATGAEIALMPECIRMIKGKGIMLHIRRSAETILAEPSEAGHPRLVLQEMHSGTEVDLHEQSVSLYAQELSRYQAAADLTIENNGHIEEGVDKLVKLIRGLS